MASALPALSGGNIIKVERFLLTNHGSHAILVAHRDTTRLGISNREHFQCTIRALRRLGFGYSAILSVTAWPSTRNRSASATTAAG